MRSQEWLDVESSSVATTPTEGLLLSCKQEAEFIVLNVTHHGFKDAYFLPTKPFLVLGSDLIFIHSSCHLQITTPSQLTNTQQTQYRESGKSEHIFVFLVTQSIQFRVGIF